MGDIAKKSVLLKTSSAADILVSGGVVNITGLQGFRLKDILYANQINYKAEVVQVVTTGGGSYTPAASTKYIIQLISPGYGKQGSALYNEKRYSYVTPSDITVLGATAALQREAIHADLVAKINADASNYVVAASLGTGTGFTITDDAGYFPARVNGSSNGREGATIVKALKDVDGSGWTDSVVTSITTAAVYGFGVGARLIQDTPVYANMTGNLISGEIDAPVAADGTFAVSGQKYNAFGFQVLTIHDIPTVGNGVQGYKINEKFIFVDNGKGSTTTNAAGYDAFEMHFVSVLSSLYSLDSKNKVIAFNTQFGLSGTAAYGTANSLCGIVFPTATLNYTCIGTQTITGPTLSSTGLLLDQDDNAGDGAHYSGLEANATPGYVVGTEAFSIVARVNAGDWTDTHILVGFRKKAVYTADFNDYTDLAAIGTGAADGDSVWTTGILNNAATLNTDSAIATVDGTSKLFEISVALSGAVTAKVDGVSIAIYSAGTTALVLDAGDEMIPFFQHVNIGSGNPAVVIASVISSDKPVVF